MHSVRVYGGVAAPKARRDGDVILDPAAPHGESDTAVIRLHELTRKMVSELPPRCIDLLEIASYVYSSDQLTKRDSSTMPAMGAGWRRSFEFHIAVRDPSFWSREDVQEQLSRTLGFLSDDTYAFDFIKYRARKLRQSFLDYDANGPAAGFMPDEVMLFSGGLDSFAGAAEAVLARGMRVALVSHRASPMVASFQNKLVHALRQRSGYDRVLHLSVGVTKGRLKAVEFTQRTRSFLFAVLGFLVAHLFGRPKVSFYENGVVSLNLPLASHVVGSRATRTTHPRVLHDFGALFSLVTGSDVCVENPFFWKTKADIVQRIADLGCGDLIPTTFSCANVREATKMSGRHCGVCSQCLDRRFGVLAADCGRFEPPETYDVELFRGARDPGVDAIMAESYVMTAYRYSRASEQAFLGNSAELLRAIPYLGGLRPVEAVNRLHRLHRRHGEAVMSIIDRNAPNVDTVSARLDLPDSSLLAMITGSQAQDIDYQDLVELDPPAPRQAEERPLGTVPRPITFAADADTKRVVFTDRSITLSGKSAHLIQVLLRDFRDAHFRGTVAADIPFMKWPQLASQLGVSETGLRQTVLRARIELAHKFREAFGAELQDDDIVQSRRWMGYRLNPHLALAPTLLNPDKIHAAAE